MRIALVSPFDPFPSKRDGRAHVGGVERVFAELANRLAARGHDVTVVCSADALGRGTEGDNLKVVRVRRKGTVLRAPIADLAKALPKADMVHVAATYPFITPAIIRAARRRGIPCVLDFHFEPDPVSMVGRVAARMYRVLGPRSYPQADTVLVRSMAYGHNAPSLGLVPEERWRTLPNGIDPVRFHPDGPRTGDGHILFVGRLVPYKGLDTLLDAMSRLAQPPPLWIVGDGPLRRHLEQKAKSLDLQARFLGCVDDKELPRLYRGACLTVLPSVGRQECFGITLLESMACGTPVVASAIPGVEEVARCGGLVCPPGDVDALAWSLAEALHGETALVRGVALADAIHDRFSWDAIAARLEDIYNETNARRVPGGPSHAHPGRDAVLRA